jgi:hypothetical protein
VIVERGQERLSLSSESLASRVRGRAAVRDGPASPSLAKARLQHSLCACIWLFRNSKPTQKKRPEACVCGFVLASIMMSLGHRSVPRLIELIRKRQDRRVDLDKY